MSKELIGSHSVHETLVRQTQIDAARIEELRTQINALRCAIKAVQENGDEQSFVSLYETLASTPEQSLAEYRNKLIEQMIACYSPDDSAHDYFDKLDALKDQK